MEDSEDGQRSNVFTNMIKTISQDWTTYLRVTGAQKIIRRYFAMNAFDGAMTSLGIVMGSWLSGSTNAGAVISVILTGAVAMMVSGFSGTYMTESAERSHSLNELEGAMLVDLDNTIYSKAGRFVSIFAAVVDGSAPFLASVPSVIPFLIPGIAIQTGFIISAIASLATLFALGIYLGNIGGENIWYSGAKMVVSGIAVAIIALLLNAH